MCHQRNHDALKRDPKAWEDLEYVGIQRVPEIGNEAAYHLELRNCAKCGSTLAVQLDPRLDLDLVPQ
jgi:hypothetical protein